MKKMAPLVSIVQRFDEFLKTSQEGQAEPLVYELKGTLASDLLENSNDERIFPYRKTQDIDLLIHYSKKLPDKQSIKAALEKQFREFSEALGDYRIPKTIVCIPMQRACCKFQIKFQHKSDPQQNFYFDINCVDSEELKLLASHNFPPVSLTSANGLQIQNPFLQVFYKLNCLNNPRRHKPSEFIDLHVLVKHIEIKHPEKNLLQELKKLKALELHSFNDRVFVKAALGLDIENLVVGRKSSLTSPTQQDAESFLEWSKNLKSAEETTISLSEEEAAKALKLAYELSHEIFGDRKALFMPKRYPSTQGR